MKPLIKQYGKRIKRGEMAATANWVIEQGMAIQQIAAPTFDEGNRAAYVAEQFRALGLADVRIDEMFNVYGRMDGATHRKALMVMAHTDTVFAAETDLTLQHSNGSIHGPGLGDNSMGVSGILGVAYHLRQQKIMPSCDLWFVATSREEGLGNLDGARMAYETLKDRVHGVVNVEGLAYGYVYHAGIAVRRLHIVAHAQGGHSWLHFGRPSATHAIVELGAKILTITPPSNPRTTYNIGMLEGGQSINSIASKAGLWLDMRSERTDALQQLERTVRHHIDSLTNEGIRFDVEVVGDRPAGHMDIQHPLVQGALFALEETGVRGSLQIGSTDGNIPLADNCPTVTVGITRGGNAHRLDEFIETSPVENGMRQLLILTLSAAEHFAQQFVIQ